MVDFLDHDFLQDQLANINKGLKKDMDKLTEANDTIKRLNKDIKEIQQRKKAEIDRAMHYPQATMPSLEDKILAGKFRAKSFNFK